MKDDRDKVEAEDLSLDKDRDSKDSIEEIAN